MIRELLLLVWVAARCEAQDHSHSGLVEAPQQNGIILSDFVASDEKVATDSFEYIMWHLSRSNDETPHHLVSKLEHGDEMRELSTCGMCGGGYAHAVHYCGSCGCGKGCSTGCSCSICECPAGQYESVDGYSSASVSCSECPGGQYSSGVKNTACTACPSGQYAYKYAYAGSTSCDECPGGQYQSGTGNTACNACPGNYYCPQGATGYYGCPAGYYCPASVSTYYACPAGKFSYAYSSSCSNCAAGHYNSAESRTTACSSECPAGKYSLAGASGCTNCGAGTYNSNTVRTEACAEYCSAGKYSNAGASSCTNCGAGTYSNSLGSTGCANCGAGKSSGAGDTGCTNCISGKYANVAGLTSCKNCATGKFSGVGDTGCTNCAAGKYADAVGTDVCDLCPAGEYSAAGSIACTPCGAGYASTTDGSSSCGACGTGTFSASGADSCSNCPSGQFGSVLAATTCGNCIAGKFSGEGATGCTLCAAGKANSVAGWSSCGSCPLGKYASGTGNTDCSSCGGGAYQDEVQQVGCKSCLAGWFTVGPGAHGCTACTGGLTSGVGESECTNQCAAGTYLQASAASCLNCPAGQYSTLGVSACTPCVAGRYASSSNTENECAISPAGHYVESAYADAAPSCAAGKYSSAGATGCTNCLAGTFSAEGSASCDGVCPAGTYSAAGSFSCTSCDAGRTSSSGSASCSLCPCGQYSSSGDASCSNCGPGTFNLGSNPVDCDGCGPGYYQPASGQCSCSGCPAGKFASGSGNSGCSDCDAGKYSESTQSSCSSCLAGWYAPVPGGASVCLVCPQGRFAADDTAAVCAVCPAGTISFTASSSCSACPSGTYSEAEASTCLYCNNGKFSSNANSEACEVCAEGTFSSSTGAFQACTGCARGQYASTPQASACDPCPAGQWANLLSQSSCQECSAGYYCTEGSQKDKEFDCVNGTMALPEDFYCPLGSGFRVAVPPNFFSTPLSEASARNRVGAEKCPSTKTCISGVQYEDFFWTAGDCSVQPASAASDDGGDEDGNSPVLYGKVTVFVDESLDGLAVGGVQMVESPFPVEFTIDPASSYQNNGSFELRVLNATTAQVFVYKTNGLDFETQDTYNVGLVATSNGSTINCSLTVAVADKNDPPVLLLGDPPSRNVSEAASLNEPLDGPPIQVLDPDTSDEHTFRIVDSDPVEGLGFFGVGGCSGKLFVAKIGLNVLVTPQYNLTVCTTDDNKVAPLGSCGNISIDVINANDPPYFKLDDGEPDCQVYENALPHASVWGRNCSGGLPWGDPDQIFGDYVVWEISRNDESDTFKIDSSTGELSVKLGASIDFENKDSYSIAVRMTDTGGLTATMPIEISVVNVNEAPTTTYPSLFILENSLPGTPICTGAQVFTDDPDSGTTQFSYRLENGNYSDAAMKGFNITKESGALLVGPGGLDFETKSSYFLQVATTDFGLEDSGVNRQSSTTTVHVTVLNVNEDPTLSVDEEGYHVDENSPIGSTVGFVYVSDPDQGQTHSFTLEGADSDVLTVGADDTSVSSDEGAEGAEGTIFVGGLLDYETRPVLRLNVTTSDGTLVDTKTVTIYVNDTNDSPVCPVVLQVTAYENRVGVLNSTDFPNARFFWNFTEQDAFSSKNGWGKLRVSASSAASGGSFTVAAECKRHGALAPSPFPTLTTMPSSLPSSSAPPSSLPSPLPSSSPSALPDRRRLLETSQQEYEAGCPSRSAKLTLLTPLDHETSPTVTFTATATDGGGLECSTEVTMIVLDVNEPPYFETKPPSYNTTTSVFYCPELVENGYEIGTVAALDPDDTNSLYGQLSYSVFVPTEPCPTGPNNTFVDIDTVGTLAVDSDSGLVTLANKNGIMYPGLICAGVRATDGMGLTADAIVIVVSVDQNSAPHLIPQRIVVPENTPSYSNLTVLVGMDPDPGSGLTFTITNCLAFTAGEPGQPNGTLPCKGRDTMFSIGPSFGGNVPMEAWLRLDASQLDFEDTFVFGDNRPPTFILTVQVEDDPFKLTKLVSTSTITIVVSDVPEPPTMADTAFTVLESASVGSFVGNVSFAATDQDAGSSLEFSLDQASTYQFTSGSGGSTGGLTFDACKSHCHSKGLQMLCVDSSAKEQAVVSAYATSSASKSASMLDNVWIGLRESRDTLSPEFGQFLWQSPGCESTYVHWMADEPSEAAYSGPSLKECVSVSLRNHSQWRDNQCSVKPDAGATECACERGPFALSPGGALATTSALDFESMSAYSLEVVVHDNTGLSAVATVEVSVLNVAEAPVIYPGQVFSVLEGVPRGTTVGQVLSHDEDVDDQVTYELLNGTEYFTISAGEGALFAGGSDVALTLDFECINRFDLMVRATSGGESVQTLVTVLIDDVDDLTVTAISLEEEGGLATLGGGLVTLSGTNMGPCGGSTTQDGVSVTATYTNGLDGLVYEATNCQPSNTTNTLVTCTAAPGVGSAHSWNVTVDASNQAVSSLFVGGRLPSRAWSALTPPGVTSSYRAPTVTNVNSSSPALMPTSGGATTVTVTGTDFPPFVCSSALACGGMQSMAWQLSTPALDVAIQWSDENWESASGNGAYVDVFCESIVVTVGGTQAECVVGQGLGSGLWWGVTVGVSGVEATAQTSEPPLVQFLTSGFAPPTIASLESVSESVLSGSVSSDPSALATRGLHSLRSSGGDTILISGANFGPADFTSGGGVSAVLSAPILVVTYGSSGGDDTSKYLAAECAVVEANVAIACTTSPGVGANLTWRVGVAGQWGSSSGRNSYLQCGSDHHCLGNLTSSYAPPYVTPKSAADSSSGSSDSFSGSSSVNAVTGAGVSGASTGGGQLLVVEGIEFGPQAGEEIPVVTYGPSERNVGKYSGQGCAVSVEFNQVRCLTSEGVGKNHWLQVTVGGQASNAYEANISYSPPNVAEYVSNWDTARTEGGEFLIISGRNFGTVAEDAITQVRYTSSASSSATSQSEDAGSNVVFFPCRAEFNNATREVTLDPFYDGSSGALVEPCPCHVITDHVAINCTTVPGAGARQSWVVSVAGQESTAATTSYGIPAVWGLSGPGSANASTYGSQAVTITGENFGPVTGAGASGQLSFLDSVTYGPGGTEYEAANCEVTTANTGIVCLTVPGVGLTLYWVVTVDGQASLLSASTSGYAAPMLLGLFPTYVDTQGGSAHVLNGTNLGMASADTYLQVFFDGTLLDLTDGGSFGTAGSGGSSGVVDTIFPASSEFMTKTAATGLAVVKGQGGGVAEEASTTGYWEALTVVLPRLDDEEHEKELVVVVGHRSFGGASMPSNSVVARYKPPQLLEVQNTPGGVEGTQQVTDLVLLGSNFGVVGTVLMAGGKQEVEVSRISSWDDGRIELSVVADTGNVTVVVGSYRSATVSFDDFSPIVYTSFVLGGKSYSPDPSGYRTDALSDAAGLSPSAFATYDDYEAAVNKGGSSRRNLTLAGIYFGNLESVLEVTIGEPPHVAPCALWPGSLVELPILSSVTVRSVSCELPSGAGPTNRVVLSRSGKSSYQANSSQVLNVKYHGPVITNVEPLQVRTHGSQVVTVTGRNFGSLSRVGVFFGATKLVAGDFTSTSFTVTTPEGQGQGQALAVQVAGQATTVYATEAEATAHGQDVADPATAYGFKYYAPSVGSVELPTGGLSTLGGFVTVTGSDMGMPGSLKTSQWRSAVGVAAARRRLLDAFDPSEWTELDFSAVVMNSTHDHALVWVGAGEGLNSLMVNVSGQVSLTPLAYALPVLTSVNPSSSPTAGQINVTVRGENLGVGAQFSLTLTSSSPSGSSVHCSHEWTEADLGTSVMAYSHSVLWFTMAQGQCDDAMLLALNVAGQASNALPFSFQPPTIAYLSTDGGANPLGLNCVRSSPTGCGLSTKGGYVVTVVGENFGVGENFKVWFRGVPLEAERVTFTSHTTATFVVPPGTGAGIDVMVNVGAKLSPATTFSYDPPWVTSITPNEFDASDDLIEIFGYNFGESLEDAGAVAITIGNSTCSPVTVGATLMPLWQMTLNDIPYLWCHIHSTTVGLKSVELTIAGQNLTRDAESSGVRGVCQSGYYGQPAWTVFTSSLMQCSLPCGEDADTKKTHCNAFYDKNDGSGKFRVEAPYTSKSPECQAEWSCMSNALLAEGASSNCTVLTLQDEQCAECPVGSVCEDYSPLYSVEPLSIPGWWRDAVVHDDPKTGFKCDPKRMHRPYCWDLQPCSPSEACLGDNSCSKGYTANKCAQCCDYGSGENQDGSKNEECFADGGEGDQLLYHRIYGKCEKCPQNLLWILVGALLVLVFAVLVGRRMQKKQVDLAIFSIGVDYMQVLAIFASTGVNWPPSVEALFRLCSVFNFSINLTPPECAFNVSYRIKWLVVEWAPTMFFLSILLLYGATLVYFRFWSGARRRLEKFRNKAVSGSLLLMYVLYLNISENTLDPLNCRHIESPDGTPSDRQFMVSQPSEVCWEKEFPTLQMELAPYAYTFFVMYTLGYPLLVAYLVLRPENAHKSVQDQLLRCMGTGSKKATNKAFYSHRTKFATLYFKFKPKYYYWILFIILRKLCIVTFTLAFHVNATMQLSMILLVVFISYTLQVKYNPYLSRMDYHEILGELDEEDYQGLVGPDGSCPQPTGIGYEVMLAEKEAELEISNFGLGNTGSGKKKNMQSMWATLQGGERERGESVWAIPNLGANNYSGKPVITREEAKVVGTQALAYLFNYNTVESTLLFSAILVCLFGIMFASGFTTNGDIMYARLGEMTLAVIVVSLVYYFLVVWTEVVAVMFPSLELSFVGGAVDRMRDLAIDTELDEDGNEVEPGGKDGWDRASYASKDSSFFEDPSSLSGEDKAMEEAANKLGLSGEDRDEFILKEIEKEIEYAFDFNPVMVAELEEEAKRQGTTVGAMTGGALGGTSGDTADFLSQARLLSLPEQVALQTTIERLHEELRLAKKKNAQDAIKGAAAGGADSSSALAGGGGAGKKKKMTKFKGKVKMRDDDDNDIEMLPQGGGSIRESETYSRNSPGDSSSAGLDFSMKPSGGAGYGEKRKSMAMAMGAGVAGGVGGKKSVAQSTMEQRQQRNMTVSQNIGMDEINFGNRGGGRGRNSVVISNSNPMQNMMRGSQENPVLRTSENPMQGALKGRMEASKGGKNGAAMAFGEFESEDML